MPVTLTVFTPAYNRAYCLRNGYDALCRQTSTDFLWLIIDDGSIDDTKVLVESWQSQENGFEIQYVYKENGGLHTAYNAAIERLTTELSVCVDSDDYLPDDAVERIIRFWQQNGSDEYAGILGLDFTPDGQMIGDPLPDQKSVNLIDIALGKYKLKSGDRKNVVRSELYKSVAPQPSFPGEKFFNPSYMHMQISKKYDFLVMNENLCFVDYQPNGMSGNMLYQYYNSPRSFAELRKLYLGLPNVAIKMQFRLYIHYVSSCIITKKWCGLKTSNILLLTCAAPFGLMLAIVVKYKNRRRK